MVFKGERNIPADSLKPQPLILPDHRQSYMADCNTVACTEKYSV
ncbi:Sulfatase family protein [Escherichia coli P12b]|nr:Sulfatase family protein [Escherichia coli P12b]